MLESADSGSTSGSAGTSGDGSAAGVSAMRMKDELRMWVLLPKGLDIASKHAQLLRTRGASQATPAECVLEDPELCVE